MKRGGYSGRQQKAALAEFNRMRARQQRPQKEAAERSKAYERWRKREESARQQEEARERTRQQQEHNDYPEPPTRTSRERTQDNGEEIARGLLDRLESWLAQLVDAKLSDLPIEQEAADVAGEISIAIDLGEYDAIADNADEIEHLFSQAISYRHKEKKGKAFYINFLNRIRQLMHGTTYEELGGFDE